jgi:hypothetical protein
MFFLRERRFAFTLEDQGKRMKKLGIDAGSLYLGCVLLEPEVAETYRLMEAIIHVNSIIDIFYDGTGQDHSPGIAESTSAPPHREMEPKSITRV